ncbi:MAG: hypothetical protein QOC71_1796 [Thermoplasmata archaeon]|nr:hypothetical protein [Thermoplasmata archaeon]
MVHEESTFVIWEPRLKAQALTGQDGSVRLALVALAVLLLAGCSDTPSTQTDADLLQVTEEGSQDLVAVAPAPVEPEFRVLVDINRSYTNPTPPPSPESGGNEWVVAEIEVPWGYSNVTFDFWRSHVSADVFAPNCRLYKGDALQDQEAFSDSGIGQAASEGTCTLKVKELAAGTYRAVYLDDGLQPLGSHEIRLRTTGWYTEPSDDGFEGRSART